MFVRALPEWTTSCIPLSSQKGILISYFIPRELSVFSTDKFEVNLSQRVTVSFLCFLVVLSASYTQKMLLPFSVCMCDIELCDMYYISQDNVYSKIAVDDFWSLESVIDFWSVIKKAAP